MSRRPSGFDIGEASAHGADELRPLHQIVVGGGREEHASGSAVLRDDERLPRVSDALEEL